MRSVSVTVCCTTGPFYSTGLERLSTTSTADRGSAADSPRSADLGPFHSLTVRDLSW